MVTGNASCCFTLCLFRSAPSVYLTSTPDTVLPSETWQRLTWMTRRPWCLPVRNRAAVRVTLTLSRLTVRLVCAGGVGFDINCGVRLLRTNLDEGDVQPVKEQLAQSMFDHIPVGVGSKGVIPMGAK